MTLEEISKKYNIAPSTFKSNFSRERDKIYRNLGVKIIKEGRGANVTYREEFMPDNRAENIFQAVQPNKQTGFMRTDLGLSNFTFATLMGVITTPMFVFRGSYEEFLGYIGKNRGADEINALKNSINELVNLMIIHEIIDTTVSGEEIITLSLVRKAELDMNIGMAMAGQCKVLADKNGINDWINVVKMWVATELLAKSENPYTKQDIIDMTGLSDYMVRKISKILKNSNVYKATRAYIKFNHCIGMITDMNNEAFYEI